MQQKQQMITNKNQYKGVYILNESKYYKLLKN